MSCRIFLSTLVLFSLLGTGCGKAPSNEPAAPATTPAPTAPTAPEPLTEPNSPPPSPAPSGERVDLIPAKVRAAGDSVFEILVPRADTARKLELNFFSTRQLKADIENSKATPQEKLATRLQIEACESAAGFSARLLGYMCEFSDHFNAGTAFVTDDGQRLWTALNRVKRGLGFVASMKGGPAAPMFLFDSKGELVLNSLVDPVSVSLRPEPASLKYFSFIYVPNHDYIAFNVPKLGPGLQFSKHAPAIGEALYAVGVSGASPESQWLDFNFGRVAFADLFELVNLNPAERFHFDATPVLVGRIEGDGRNVGGPTLDANGDVLAIRSLVFSELSIFVRPPVQ